MEPSPHSPSFRPRGRPRRAWWLGERRTAHRLRRATASFLAAEAKADDAAAEAALRTLFAALPRTAPRAGFAERVLAVAGVAPPPASPVLRWAAVAAVLLAGLSLGALAPALWALARHLEPAGLVAAGVELLATGFGIVEVAAPLWRLALALSRTAGALLAQPPVLALLLLAAASGAALHRLSRSTLTDDFRRSSAYG